MIKIYGLLDDVGTEYPSYYPIALSDNLDSIKEYAKTNNISLKYTPIVYKELCGTFKSGFINGDVEDREHDWDYWEGEKCLGHTWHNKKTGEYDTDFENREDVPESEIDDWEDGHQYEVYKEGKLIKTYFC